MSTQQYETISGIDDVVESLPDEWNHVGGTSNDQVEVWYFYHEKYEMIVKHTDKWEMSLWPIRWYDEETRYSDFNNPKKTVWLEREDSFAQTVMYTLEETAER